VIPIEDNELIKSAVRGSTTAFEQIVKKYQTQVFNLCLRMLGNEDDAADATQDSFVKVWKSLNTFQFESQFSTWLYKLASHTCLDYLRKRKRRKEVSMTVEDDDEEHEWDMPDKSPGPDEAYEAKEDKIALSKALDMLEPSQKQIIILRVVNDLSYQQIAEVMGIAEGTVKSRLSRARDNLRTKLLILGNQSISNTSKKRKGGCDNEL